MPSPPKSSKASVSAWKHIWIWSIRLPTKWTKDSTRTKDEIVGQKTLQFDISQFMTMLYAVAPGNTDFKLTATDASGQNIKSIMLYVPQQ